MLQLNNYVIVNSGKFTGHIAQIKSLNEQDILAELEDGSRISMGGFRFIELGLDVLLKLKDPEYPGQVATHLKTHDYELHKKIDVVLDLRGKKFYLHGFLHGNASIWQFGNVITIHYLHQLQNLVKILNPEIDLLNKMGT